MKVRFHLQKGSNFMHWQIKDAEGNVSYVDPEKASLILKDTCLKNRQSTAKKIHAGAHKAVCAWINVSEVEVVVPQDIDGIEVCYNPREKPFWQDEVGNNIDGGEFATIVSSGRKLKVIVD